MSSDMTIGEAAEKVMITAHSRYPVFGASMNDVEGVVMKQDLLQALTEGKEGNGVTSVMRETIVAEEGLHSDELLTLFRDRKSHLAVVQEDDHTIGVVTLEDILEELVGEIEDETDAEE